MKKTMFIMSLSLFFLACEKSGMDCCVDYATTVEISIHNENGVDLLDPQNPDAYKIGDIELQYKVEGEIKEVDKKMFDLFEHELEYRIGIPLNETGQPSITYIKWNATDTDTIKAEFQRWNNGIQVTDVWFNGELKNPHYFDIVKNP